MNDTPSPTSPVDKIVAEFLLKKESDTDIDNLDVETLCETHPQYADAIREYFSTKKNLTLLLDPNRVPNLKIDGYEIVGEIGRGGMGVVFEAIQTSLERPVAIKVLKNVALASVAGKQRFTAEAKLIAQLRDDTIVDVIDFGDVNGIPYMVMPLVSKDSLSSIIRGNPLQHEDVTAVLLRVLKALQIAHGQRIIHRDIKPGNILIDGSLHKCKLSDFGLAVWDQSDRFTETGDIVGTVGYIAPEIIRGNSKGDELTDIYSVGATMYAMLTGVAPFKAATPAESLLLAMNSEPASPRKINPMIPQDLESICLKCMHGQPNRRYGSATAVQNDLNRFLNDEPVVARPVGWIERLERWAKRNKGLAAASSLAIAACLAAICGGIYSFIAIDRSNSQLADSLHRQKELTLKSNDSLGKSISAIKEFYVEFGNANFLADTETGLGFRNRMLDQGVTYLQSFIEENKDNQDLQFELGSAYGSLVSLYNRTRNYKMQREANNKAIIIFQSLHEASPENLLVCNEFGNALLIEAEMSSAFDGFEAALPFFEKAAQVTERLPAAAEMGNDGIEGADAAKHFLATIIKYRRLHKTGQQNRARSNAHKEFLNFEKFALKFPEDARLQFRVSQASNWVGILHAKSGDPEAAVELYEKCRNYALKANSIEPHDDYLANATYGSGNLVPTLVQLSQKGNSEFKIGRAIEIQQQTVEELKTLASRNPNNLSRQYEYANGLVNLGGMLANEKDQVAMTCFDTVDELLGAQFLLHTKSDDPANWLALATVKSSNIGSRATFWCLLQNYEKQIEFIDNRIRFDREVFDLRPDDLALKLELATFLDSQIGLLFEVKEFERGLNLLTRNLDFQSKQLEGSDQVNTMANRLLSYMKALKEEGLSNEWPKDFSDAYSNMVESCQRKLKSLTGDMRKDLSETVDQLKAYQL